VNPTLLKIKVVVELDFGSVDMDLEEMSVC